MDIVVPIFRNMRSNRSRGSIPYLGAEAISKLDFIALLRFKDVAMVRVERSWEIADLCWRSMFLSICGTEEIPIKVRREMRT